MTNVKSEIQKMENELKTIYETKKTVQDKIDSLSSEMNFQMLKFREITVLIQKLEAKIKKLKKEAEIDE